MIRKIITINEDKCNGCGLCSGACHEGAIGMVEGKAKNKAELQKYFNLPVNPDAPIVAMVSRMEYACSGDIA